MIEFTRLHCTVHVESEFSSQCRIFLFSSRFLFPSYSLRILFVFYSCEIPILFVFSSHFLHIFFVLAPSYCTHKSKRRFHGYFGRGRGDGSPTAPPGHPHGTPRAPPGTVEHFFGTRKIKNLNLRSSDAELSSGTHITHP